MKRLLGKIGRGASSLGKKLFGKRELAPVFKEERATMSKPAVSIPRLTKLVSRARKAIHNGRNPSVVLAADLVGTYRDFVKLNPGREAEILMASGADRNIIRNLDAMLAQTEQTERIQRRRLNALRKNKNKQPNLAE